MPDAARFCPRCGAPAPTFDASTTDAAPVTDPVPGAASEGERQRPPYVAPVASAPANPPASTPDLPPEGLHFGPVPRAVAEPRSGERAEPRRAPLPPPLAPAPARGEPAGDDDDDDGGGTGTGTRLLVILALIAAAVLAVVFWQQRDGTRPVAATATNTSEPAAEPTPEPSEEPTEVASLPPPEPTPTPSPTIEVAQTGDEIGSTASLDPNGEAAIPAAAIDTAFDDDADRAAEEFPGPVTVRGTVVGLLSDSPPALSLEGRSRGNYVIADLAPGQRDALQLLARGSVVRLRCGAVRYQSGTTVLYGCRI